MTYVRPGVEVNYSTNPRIVSLGQDVKIPAVVGLGPSSLYVTDEAVQRSSGSGVTSKDYLAHAAASAVSSVNSLPNRAGTAYTSGSSAGQYQLQYDTVGAYFTWTSGSGYPAQDSIYYTDYTYAVPSTQYDPQTFTTTDDVLSFYGAENTTSGSVAIAANLALENGAPAVMCVQQVGSAYSEAAFKAAIDKLEKKDNVAFVVPISTQVAIRSYALQHCIKMSSSAYNRERTTVCGLVAGSSIDTYVTTAKSLVNSRMALVAPESGITRTDADGNSMTLDASYLGAVVAGAQTGMEKIIQPITGKTVVGVSVTDDMYSEYEKARFAGNGIVLLYSRAGAVKVFHAVTTDPSSADTAEICVQAGLDKVQSQTRDSLTNLYMGKGIVIDTSTPTDIEESLKSIWDTMVKDGWIASYGQTDDPTTGERKVRALQDSAEPRKIRVTGAVKLLYPLTWITVDFTTYV